MSSFEMLGVFTPGQKALVRGWWRKVTAAHPSARNFKDMRVPIVDKGVFGILLVESIKYAHSSISYIDDVTETQCFGAIPTIIAKCGSFLKEEAMTTEGIFRISGSSRRIRMLQSIFDTPELYGSQLDWRGYTVHDAANVMKRFLNFLPEPVITLEYYRKLKDTTIAEYPNVDAKIEAVQGVIECLPIAHQYLLLYLLDMLGMFVTAQDYTRMDTACLAAVFAPGILSHPDDELNPAGYLESQRVLIFLIEHQERFSMPRAHTFANTTDQNNALPPSNSVPPKIKDFNKAIKEERPNPPQQRASTIYSLAAGSYSGSGIESILDADLELPPPTVTLRRSKTAPSRRDKYGSHEPQQIVHVNRTSSQGSGNRRGHLKTTRIGSPMNQ
ncbi:Rho GTPase activation protein [Parasitella parasitica]|nr:Rho GTPase activation protein [Parasitella parasitica]